MARAPQHRSGRTRDGRGRVVKLLDPMPLHTLGRYDVIDREALVPIVEALEPGSSRKRPAMIIALGVGVLVLIAIAVMVTVEGRPALSDLAWAVTNPAILAAVVGGGVLPWFVSRRERLRKVHRIMLDHRRCPHCGYGLTGVPPAEDDGLTVCPECACAWPIPKGDPTAPPVATTGGRSTIMLLALTILGALMAAGLAVYMLMR